MRPLSRKQKYILFIGIIDSVLILCVVAAFIHVRNRRAKDRTDAAESSDVVETKDGLVEDGDDYKYYVDGEMQSDSWEQAENGDWYYVGYNGNVCRGFYNINDVTYFFNDDGSLYTGWKLRAGHWYYFTENGAVKGYQVILDEYGNSNEYYFDDSCYLVTDAVTPDGRYADEDGYLASNEADNTAAATELSGFEYAISETKVPGALSGISIAGEPAEFYMLSIAGETSGGQIIMGDRGRAYGLCQYDYRYDLTDFMTWAYQRHPELWIELAAYTSIASGSEELVGNIGIAHAFQTARGLNYEAAITDELEYMRERYWDSFAARMNAAGFNLSERHIAVSAAMFSVNVNCGTQADVFISNLSPDMTDAELICGVYKIRNSILSEQTVGRYGKKGTNARYQSSEPQMALDLYYGFTTIDTSKNYGGGVQWCGDIFADQATTVPVEGVSEDWMMVLANASESPNVLGAEEESADTDEITEESLQDDAVDDVSAISQESDATSNETEKSSYRVAAIGPGGTVMDDVVIGGK